MTTVATHSTLPPSRTGSIWTVTSEPPMTTSLHRPGLRPCMRNRYMDLPIGDQCCTKVKDTKFLARHSIPPVLWAGPAVPQWTWWYCWTTVNRPSYHQAQVIFNGSRLFNLRSERVHNPMHAACMKCPTVWLSEYCESITCGQSLDRT
jgi:hypothetical protein